MTRGSRQARAAEQYQALQAERLNKDAQLKALEFRRYDADLKALTDGLTQDEIRLQSLLADQRQAEAQIEACRSQQGEASEALGRAIAEIRAALGDESLIGEGVHDDEDEGAAPADLADDETEDEPEALHDEDDPPFDPDPPAKA